MSASEQSKSLIHRKFGDFLEILRSRGLDEKAELYETVLSVECFLQDIDDPMNLTVEETISLIEKPETLPTLPVPSGWSNFYWGKAVLE